jgi:predicted metal-dependent enzyme (double-stranded beta helix superfamily)
MYKHMPTQRYTPGNLNPLHTHASKGVIEVFWDLDDEENQLLGCVVKTLAGEERAVIDG